MYDQFYGFSARPFQLAPDPEFYFESLTHRKALSYLGYGLSQGEGFIVITGEVGAGKTTLVERLWSQLDRDTYTIGRIATTQVSGEDLFRLAMAGFGLHDESSGRANLLRRFDELLQEHKAAGKHCLLVVDEVQNLSLAALEELRMLSNMTSKGGGALQTILLGQPQFRKTLASPDLDQLRQRVLASYHLGPLSEEETRAYIEHRMKTAGWDGRPAWEEEAFATIFRHTDGIPRRINRLCSRALMHGALDEQETITVAMIETTAAELAEDLRAGTVEDGNAEPGQTLNMGADVAALAAGGHEFGVADQRLLGHLLARVTALEERLARREQMFQRLAALLISEQGG